MSREPSAPSRACCRCRSVTASSPRPRIASCRCPTSLPITCSAAASTWDFSRPKVRLPGAGGAPEIATYAREVLIVMKQSPRSFVSQLDFVTSCGYLSGSGTRRRSGAPGSGPRAVITDFGILRPAPETDELQLTGLYPGVTVEATRNATGWPLQVAEAIEKLPPPERADLEYLRDLHARTEKAHASSIRIKLPA